MMRWPTDPDEKSRRLALPVPLFRRRPAGTVQTRSSGSDGISAKPGFLREVRVFAPLSEEEHRWLNTNTTMVTYERGRLFYRPNERGEVLFILKRGRVNFFRLSGDGRKLTVTTLRAGTIFGEMALMGQAMYGCFAEAAEDCLLCVLSRSDMQTIIRRNPEVALRLLDELGTRLQEREAALEALAFRSVPSRLASLLLVEADAFGLISGQTHQDLANSLGTHRETVSETLGKFRVRRLVVTEPKRIKLLDLEGLEAIARS